MRDGTRTLRPVGTTTRRQSSALAQQSSLAQPLTSHLLDRSLSPCVGTTSRRFGRLWAESDLVGLPAVIAPVIIDRERCAPPGEHGIRRSLVARRSPTDGLHEPLRWVVLEFAQPGRSRGGNRPVLLTASGGHLVERLGRPAQEIVDASGGDAEDLGNFNLLFEPASGRSRSVACESRRVRALASRRGIRPAHRADRAGLQAPSLPRSRANWRRSEIRGRAVNVQRARPRQRVTGSASGCAGDEQGPHALRDDLKRRVGVLRSVASLASLMVELLQERLDDFGIELRAGARRAIPRWRPRREGAAVRAVGGHGLVGVADGDDARAVRDLVPLRPSG